MTDERKVLGKQVSEPISAAELDLIPWNGRDILISLDCTEFTSRCPVTKQPDFAKLQISYYPADYLIETKSLKLYLQRFRESLEFNEKLVDTIAEDLLDVLNPNWLQVRGEFNHRGGISVSCEAERGDK